VTTSAPAPASTLKSVGRTLETDWLSWGSSVSVAVGAAPVAPSAAKDTVTVAVASVEGFERKRS
jgi:hypothetical protein